MDKYMPRERFADGQSSVEGRDLLMDKLLLRGKFADRKLLSRERFADGQSSVERRDLLIESFC